MDAPSQTPERSRELADLRQRAYGPDADIQRDPDALRRLHELEELERAPAMAGAEPARRSRTPVRRPSDSGDTDAPHAPAAPQTARSLVEPDAEAVRPARWRAWPIWAVAMACIIAGVLIGAGALLLWPRTAADAGADLTLHQAADRPARAPGFVQDLDYWGVERGSVVAYDAFDSMRVWTARGGGDDSRCILLSRAGQIFTASCAAQGLDPVLDYTVDGYGSVAYEDATLLEGSVVRFIARADRIDVWVRPAVAALTGLLP